MLNSSVVFSRSSANLTGFLRKFCKNVEFCEKTKCVVLLKEQLKFPAVWLRDNCQCSECFHKDSNSRTIMWKDFDVNVKPLEVKFNDNSQELSVNWSDNHKTVHTYDWLKKRNFTEDNQKNYLKNDYRPAKKLWSKKDFQKILKTFNFKDVLENDKVLHDWLESLAEHGVAIISDAPHTENEARKIADRVGFIKKTHYGEEFIVKAKEGTSNVAYLSSTLQLHSDLPYYEYKPGSNLLHCLVQAKGEGGENLLADGFYVSERIKSENPEYYELLTKILVNWTDIGNEDGRNFHSIYRAPVICEGRDHILKRINHSVPQRDSFFTVPLENVDLWYQAMALFVKLIHEESVTFKTKPGDILTFDNIRMVHGRNGYVDDGDSTRHIVGAYLDWDEIYSKLRVLKEKFN